MSGVSRGRIGWSLDTDDEGHRTYKLLTLVEMLTSINPLVAETDDGPERALNSTPGLPAIGSFWQQGNDVDQWATLWPTMKIRTYKPKGGEPGNFFSIEQIFSTRSFRTCQSVTISNPLLEPQKISGTFIKYTREARFDVNGNPIVSSSHESYTGADVEIDNNRPSIRIEQNVSVLQLGLLASMVDTINQFPMWGLAPKTIKLSNVSWERKIQGICGYYYNRILDFDINFNTFNIIVPDEGYHEVIEGEDPLGPLNFNVSQDSWDQAFRKTQGLNGAGARATTTEEIAINNFQVYRTANFNLLGVVRNF